MIRTPANTAWCHYQLPARSPVVLASLEASSVVVGAVTGAGGSGARTEGPLARRCPGGSMPSFMTQPHHLPRPQRVARLALQAGAPPPPGPMEPAGVRRRSLSFAPVGVSHWRQHFSWPLWRSATHHGPSGGSLRRFRPPRWRVSRSHATRMKPPRQNAAKQTARMKPSGCRLPDKELAARKNCPNPIAVAPHPARVLARPRCCRPTNHTPRDTQMRPPPPNITASNIPTSAGIVPIAMGPGPLPRATRMPRCRAANCVASSGQLVSRLTSLAR